MLPLSLSGLAGWVFTSRPPGWKPGQQPLEFPNCDLFSLKEIRGFMIHDQQHAKVKQEKWYKIEIITIHVQHAGLIFLMQIFVFFLYNRAGNKTDEICAQNVLTEARVSGLSASVSPSPRIDRFVCPSFLPSLSLASRLPGRQGPSPLLAALLQGGTRSGPQGSGPGSMRQVQKAGSLQTASAAPPDSALQPSKPGEKLLRDFPPPRLSPAPLESRRRRWRAPLSP